MIAFDIVEPSSLGLHERALLFWSSLSDTSTLSNSIAPEERSALTKLYKLVYNYPVYELYRLGFSTISSLVTF